MIQLGQMVRAGGSAAMKVIDISDGVAECIWIDGNGGIRRRFHVVRDLVPMWLSLGPQSLWPEITDLDLPEIEEEERRAKLERALKAKASKKAKRSNKIKRKQAA